MSDKTLMLANGKIINFTDEQYGCVNHIRKWLESQNKFFTLSGYAGTGKTSIIKKIIDEYRRSLVVSAPTHKAKKVVMSTTGCDGETLHALLGLRPDLNLDDFNPNDPKFSQIASPKIQNYRLIIIDEASMINEELYDLINKELDLFENTKVLFMGDPAQIPPIGEKLSIVFNPESNINDTYHLSKVMRQADGNPLFEIYDNLRNNIDDKYGGFLRRTKLNSNGEGVIFTKNNKKFRDKLFEHFTSPEVKDNIDYVKLIAWRNITVMGSNKIIRRGIYGEKPDFIEVGDILMGYRSIRAVRQYFNIIDNSADYRIIRIGDYYKNKYDLWCYKVTLEEKNLNETTYKKVNIIDIRDEKNIHDYGEIHDTLKLMAKADKSKWNDYYEFRRENLLMRTIDKFRDGYSRVHDEIIAKDLDYGYAITGHKSQGSTYQHVMVLEDDISLNPKIKESNQIKYVALTRPTTTATILTNIN